MTAENILNRITSNIKEDSAMKNIPRYVLLPSFSNLFITLTPDED